jgi:hypothetical protein
MQLRSDQADAFIDEQSIIQVYLHVVLNDVRCRGAHRGEVPFADISTKYSFCHFLGRVMIPMTSPDDLNRVQLNNLES